MQGQLFTQDFLQSGCATAYGEVPAPLKQALLHQHVSSVIAYSLPVLAQALTLGDLEARTEIGDGNQGAVRRYTADYLDELHTATVILFCRVLFLLLAEDRGLLPVDAPGYEIYSLRQLRERVRDQILAGKPLAARFPKYWLSLRVTFQVCSAGDDALSIPACGTSLFAREHSPLLERTSVPDAVLAPIIDRLSRDTDSGLGWISYNQLPASHLVDIGEQLFQLGLVQEVQLAEGADRDRELPPNARIVAMPYGPSRGVSVDHHRDDTAIRQMLSEALSLINNGQVTAVP